MKKSIGANTLIFPTPAWVVGSYDKEGKANVMTAAWGGVCCSKPPCVGISLRKNRGIVSGRKAEKFVAADLTPVKSDLVDAPYVKEFPLVLECRLIREIEIGVHTQLIGEIVDVKVEESVLGENGLPDIEKVKPIIYAPGAKTYHGVGKYLGKAFSIGREVSDPNRGLG
jgi:flavin reductase (DIM6/NTAB) family NADH-FMN oxidoreductase RutF